MITYRWYSFKYNLRGTKYNFKFRGLTRSELHIAAQFKLTYEAENYILSKAVETSEPIDFSSLPAGIVANLLNKITYYSGLTDKQITFAEAQLWIESEEGQLETMAMSVFPWCSKEYLDNCDPFYYAKNLVAGRYCFETALGGLQGQPPPIMSKTSKTEVAPNKELHTQTEVVRFK